jgi:hypothetical protein
MAGTKFQLIQSGLFPATSLFSLMLIPTIFAEIILERASLAETKS